MSRRYAAREWRRIGVWFAVAAAVTLAGGWLTATERRDPWIVGIIGALFLLRAGHAFWRAWRADRRCWHGAPGAGHTVARPAPTNADCC